MAAVVSPQPPSTSMRLSLLDFDVRDPPSLQLWTCGPLPASGRSICPKFFTFGLVLGWFSLIWCDLMVILLDMMDMCELNLMITFRRHLGFGPTKVVPYAHFDCLPGFSVNVPWLADIMFARELNLENIHFLCRVFTRQRNCHVIPRWIWISLNIWKLSWRTSCFQAMVLSMGKSWEHCWATCWLVRNCFRNNICWMWPLKLPYGKCDWAQKTRLEVWWLFWAFLGVWVLENLKVFHSSHEIMILSHLIVVKTIINHPPNQHK